MHPLLLRTKARLRDATKPLGEAAVGALTIALLRTTRYFDPIKTANLFGRIPRLIGPLTREQKIGRANLIAAFPEKSPEEIETILAGVWDNLGRLGAEFAHLDHVWEHDPALSREKPHRNRAAHPRTVRAVAARRQAGADLCEPPRQLGTARGGRGRAWAGCRRSCFAGPTAQPANRIIEETRAVKMGTLIPAGRDAPLRLAEALQNGQHVAMLVDQYLTNGVEVTFFGRKTKANPMLARLLRQIECPIHGVRIIRLPGHRFRAELSEEVQPVRDASGQIDIQGTTQAITSVVEGWIREYPDQWLWLHRRWR